MYFILEKATLADLKPICKFTDFWLAGRGQAKNVPGAVNDCFISPSQHKKYIEKYETFVLYENKTLTAWAVIQHDGSLIHFLIHGEYRGKGLGTLFLNKLHPFRIHSKKDQSSGDPAKFYEKCGYKKITTVKSKSRLDIDKIRPNRKPNIDIYERVNDVTNPVAPTLCSTGTN